MPLSVALERIDAARADGLDDLLQEHWEEVETDKSVAPLAIDWPGYYSLEKAQILRPLMLRRNGRLIGYTVWFVRPTLQHRDTVWAICDLLYVAPEHRGRAGVVLLRESERQVKAMGARAAFINVKPGDLELLGAAARVAPLLRRLGWTKAEETWARYF